jgi:hypothetical protein
VSDLRHQLVLPYDRSVGGQVLSFELIVDDPFIIQDFIMRDRETGSTWNILGKAISGPKVGEELAQIPAHNAFWFAWAAFWPHTEVYVK